MKKIGIVGGVGWTSTVEYYSAICRRSVRYGSSTPEMTIESLDLGKAISWLGIDGDEESWSRFDEYHRAALKRVEACGADFALLASNSPHHRLEAIVRSLAIPILSLLDVVAKETARIGATNALLLGTPLIMSSRRFREEFAKYGVEASGPESESARTLTDELIRDLQLEKVEGAAARLASIARAELPKEGRSVVCLACTELPSAFPRLKTLPTFEADGILYLNTTILHANAAFDFAA
jgi:aspartate racemase